MQADAEDLYPCDRRNPYTDSGVLTDGHRKAYVKEVVMGNTRDKIGKAGLVFAGGVFRIALYVCVAVFIFWAGKTTYQFGYDIFNQQAMSPGDGQEVTVVIPEGSSEYQIGEILEAKGLIKDAKVFYVQEKLSNYQRKAESRYIFAQYSIYTYQDHGDPCRRYRAGRGKQFVIVEERMRTFINSLDTGNTPFLEELEQYALQERVPVIRREMQSFIKYASGTAKTEAHS